MHTHLINSCLVILLVVVTLERSIAEKHNRLECKQEKQGAESRKQNRYQTLIVTLIMTLKNAADAKIRDSTMLIVTLQRVQNTRPKISS